MSRVTEVETGLEAPAESESDLNIREVYGSAENISRIGSPIELSTDGTHVRYYFYPTWRSQLARVLGYFILCVLVVLASSYDPIAQYLVLEGRLFTIYDTELWLHLPWLTLVPAYLLGIVLWHIYNSKFIIDERGVEAQVGLVSFNLRQPRLRYEDIRGIEPRQNLWERIFGIGTVLIGSAMTNDVEIEMKGVANPRGIQLLIGGEREKRMRLLQGSDTQNSGRFNASEIMGD